MGGRITIGGVLTVLLAGASISQARLPEDSPADRYEVITERNIFGLKEPQKPQQVEQQKPELPTVRLTGITTILGDKRAVLKVQEPSASPAPKAGPPGRQPAAPQPAPETESLILAEGQREGPVEVLQINEEEGTVKIANSGQVATITFEELPPEAPAPATSPGAAPPALSGVNVPPGFNTNRTLASLPAATGRLPGRIYNSTAGGTTATNPPPLPGTALPPTGVTPGPTGTAPLTSEEQEVLQHVQEILNRDRGSQPAATPLPPAGSPEQYQYQYPAAGNQPTIPPLPPGMPRPLPVYPQ